MAHPNIECAIVAHPNMEDAHVPRLTSPDGEFAGKKVQQSMSETWGWMVSGPKLTEIRNEDCILDATGRPSSKKGFPSPENLTKILNGGLGWWGLGDSPPST